MRQSVLHGSRVYNPTLQTISSDSTSSNLSTNSAEAMPENRSPAQAFTVIISDSEDENDVYVGLCFAFERRFVDCINRPIPLPSLKDSSVIPKTFVPASRATPIIVPSNPNRIRPADARPSHFMPGSSRPTSTTPVAIPTNRDTLRPVVDKTYENFDMHAAENTFEYAVSKEDAEKALQDLMSDVGNNINQEIDMSEAVVPGFKLGIKLLPHQVVGRKWMAERESGKRSGGILADDMGYTHH